MSNKPVAGGVFLPGYLNGCNSPGQSGQQDPVTGKINYSSGLTLGKAIELGMGEAQALQSPSPSIEVLYEGAYQWVQVDSGATASQVNTGLAAYKKLTSGPFVVTSETGRQATSLFAGVFLNPITPGNYGFIFVGGGRVNVTFKASLTNGSPAIGDTIAAGGGSGFFDDASATAVTNASIGIATQIPTGSGTSTIFMKDRLYTL